MRRFKLALPVVAMIGLLAAAPLALGQNGPPPPPTGWYLNVTIDKVATLENQGILLHMSGMYQCADPTNGGLNIFDPNQSGLNGGASEITKNDVVSGGFNMDGSSLNCDTSWHSWSGDFSGQGSNGPALWKAGRAIGNAGGRICDTNNNCAQGGAQVVLQIKH